MRLSQSEMEELKNAGYSELEIQRALKELESDQLNQSYGQTQQSAYRDPRQNSQLSSFAARQDNDIVRWQLELNDILERAEHILRGDIPIFKEGHIIWEKNKDQRLNCVNEYGVQETLKVLSMYVNRNTILSDYTNQEINLKVFDFGRELNNLYFMRYEDFGMDSEEKRKHYPMMIREMVDMVHSAYKRALDGSEKRSLREMISISQATNNSLPAGAVPMSNQQQLKERGLLNPMRIFGRYKAY